MEEQELRDEINKLTLQVESLNDLLEEKRSTLFKSRFLKMIGITSDELDQRDIGNIGINTDANTWDITYTHYTTRYSENNYMIDKDKDPSAEPISKSTTVVLGFNGKRYYIDIPIRDSIFSIYKNSKKELRIINKDYDIDLDPDEHNQLIIDYSNNIDIPEWIALKIFLYMIENEWSNAEMIIYLSVI